MIIPADLKYTRDHEWVRIEGDIAVVGITEFAQRELGDIVFVDVPTVGKTLEKEETFGTVEAVKTVADLFMPLSGTITEINPELDESPELVNLEPYGDGWMIKIKYSDASEADTLLSSQEYQRLIEE